MVLIHRAHNTTPAFSASQSSATSSPSSSPSAPSRSSHPFLPRIQSLYVGCDSPFPEVEAFVDECCDMYNLELVRIGGGIKEALAQYLGQPVNGSLGSSPAQDLVSTSSPASTSSSSPPGRGITALLMGTRRGDPHSGVFVSVFTHLLFQLLTVSFDTNPPTL